MYTGCSTVVTVQGACVIIMVGHFILTISLIVLGDDGAQLVIFPQLTTGVEKRAVAVAPPTGWEGFTLIEDEVSAHPETTGCGN